MRNLVGRRTSSFGWLAAVVGWLAGVSSGFLDSGSFVVLARSWLRQSPSWPSIDYGLRLPSFAYRCFFAYWQGSPRGLNDDDTPKNEVANDVF